MAIPVQCRNGHQWVVEDAYAGGTAVCPTCYATVAVPRTPAGSRDGPAAAAGLSGAAPVQDSRPSRGSQLARLNQGLGLQYARLVLNLGTLLLAMMVLFFEEEAFQRHTLVMEAVAGAGVLGIGVLLAAQLLVGILGSLLCLSAPTESRARGYILASLALDVAVLALVFLLALYNQPAYAAVVLGLGSWVLFMLFLRRLAFFFDQPGAAAEARRLLLWGTALVGIPLCILFLAGTGLAREYPSVFFGAVSLAAYLILLFGLVAFIESLVGLRRRDAILISLPLLVVLLLVPVSVPLLILEFGWAVLFIQVLLGVLEVIGTLRGVIAAEAEKARQKQQPA
jgi:hypothetical protein